MGFFPGSGPLKLILSPSMVVREYSGVSSSITKRSGLLTTRVLQRTMPGAFGYKDDGGLGYNVLFLFLAEMHIYFGTEITEAIGHVAGQKTKIFISGMDMGDSIYKIGSIDNVPAEVSTSPRYLPGAPETEGRAGDNIVRQYRILFYIRREIFSVFSFIHSLIPQDLP